SPSLHDALPISEMPGIHDGVDRIPDIGLKLRLVGFEPAKIVEPAAVSANPGQEQPKPDRILVVSSLRICRQRGQANADIFTSFGSRSANCFIHKELGPPVARILPRDDLVDQPPLS